MSGRAREHFKANALNDAELIKAERVSMPIHVYSRRAVMRHLLKSAGATVVGGPAISALAQMSTRSPNRNYGELGRLIDAFHQQFRVPAMSAAISRNGRFVYDHAGGMADRQHLTQAQQNTLFRIADLSKPITAVTIFSLIE